MLEANIDTWVTISNYLKNSNKPHKENNLAHVDRQQVYFTQSLMKYICKNIG